MPSIAQDVFQKFRRLTRCSFGPSDVDFGFVGGQFPDERWVDLISQITAGVLVGLCSPHPRHHALHTLINLQALLKSYVKKP